MNANRDRKVLSLRPEIASIDQSKNVTKSEVFQNETLRPILKYQHELIVAIFNAKSTNQQLDKLDKADQRQRITKILESNTVLRNQFIGLIIGLMTKQELEAYFEIESEMKRRIKTMLVERLIV